MNISKVNRMPLVMNFHPALSAVGNIIDSIWPIIHASDDMKEIFRDKSIIPHRRPKHFKDVFVRAKLKCECSDLRDIGMKKCGKSRCQMCKYPDEGCNFAWEVIHTSSITRLIVTQWELFILLHVKIVLRCMLIAR